MPSSNVSTSSSNYSFLKRSILTRHWQPTFNIRTGFPIILTLCILFSALSFTFFISNNSVYYYEADYTHCKSMDTQQLCADKLLRNATKQCFCQIEVAISKENIQWLHIYIKISGMYQNHRMYSESFDLKQQLGEGFEDTASDTCGRLGQINGMTIVPCGLIPNSLFNDTFTFYHQTSVVLLKENTVSIPEEKIFNNPDVNPLSDAFLDFEKPPNWPKPIYHLNDSDPLNNGFLNRRYITWLRVFPFPGVLKQLGLLERSKSYLSKDNILSIVIGYNYPVTQFDGRKLLVFSQASWLGLRNPKLGYIYAAASFICLLFIGYFSICIYKGKCPRNTLTPP